MASGHFCKFISALDRVTRAGVYNASVAGETLPTIADWTTKVVVPRLHPKVVVVGFSSNELNPSVLAPAQGLGAYQHSRAARTDDAAAAVSPHDGEPRRPDVFLRAGVDQAELRDLERPGEEMR